MSDCAHKTGGRYCPDCGHDFEPVAYDRAAFIDELVDNWWEKGVVRTFFGLFIQPGRYLRIYIERDRKLLLKPLGYAAVVITFIYWARSRVSGMVPIDTSDSAALTFLLRDPLVLTLLMAIVGASVITYITHRPAPLSIYGAIVVRLYLSVQLLIIMFAADFMALQLGARDSETYGMLRNALGYGWLSFALWQYFRPDKLHYAVLRAIAAVILGQIALLLLLFIPIAIVDEMGWLT